MEIKIISKVDISITQEDLEQLVTEKIKAHDKDIHINGIEFIQKRNPNRIAVSVDAQYGECHEEAKTEVTKENPLGDPEEDDTPVEDDSPKETVADVFG